MSPYRGSHHHSPYHHHHRHGTSKRTRRRLFAASTSLACLLLLVVLVWGWPGSHPLPHKQSQQQHRLAIVLPFVGKGPESIPPYLDVFCVGAAAAAEAVDFLLIHNGVLRDYDNNHKCPPNVKLIDMKSTSAFAEQLVQSVVSQDDSELALPRERLNRLMTQQLERFPYVLVEFKPALGTIFAEYLQDYSHWGYADVDILFGDVARWMTPDEYDYDIVTYGFGDQQRVYVRGQFTMLRNTPTINTIWRDCDYLTHMDQRIQDVITGKSHLRLESAEGCFPAAILKRTDVTVKYAVKAWTDIEPTDAAYTHGLFVAHDAKSNQHVLYKAANADDGTASSLTQLPPDWFVHDAVYSNRSQPLQRLVGKREEVALPDRNNDKVKCMYWVMEKYQSQLCLQQEVSSDETLFWIHGKLYKQRHENVPLETQHVITAPFFHFQEWKRYYRRSQLTPLHIGSEVSTFCLTKEGAIPLSRHVGRLSKLRLPSPLELPLRQWIPASNDEEHGRHHLPHAYYCLLSGPRQFPSYPPAPDCYHMVSWQDVAVEILSGAPAWNTVHMEHDVTLTLTLQVTDSQAEDRTVLAQLTELVLENVDRWQGMPCVVVIHVAGATDVAKSVLRQRLGSNSIGSGKALIAAIFDEYEDFVSRKALINMATDVAPTRWYTSGLELERGLTVSMDAAFFAHRAVDSHQSFQGSVFWLPQFALNEGQRSDLSLNDLTKIQSKRGRIPKPTHFDELCEEDEEAPSHQETIALVDQVWWEQTRKFVVATDGDESIERHATALQKIESSLLLLLTDEHHYSLFAMDESPILLVDNLGPQQGIRTSEIAREVEELGGRRCYNGLRLAQLETLGYRVNVLAGAFAASTDATRQATKATNTNDEGILGLSRCDGCAFFEDEHESILQDIVKDETLRPVKAAILWAELLGRKE